MGRPHARSARQLIEYVRHRAVADRLARDEPRPYAEAAANFDPDVLTIGFARRLATYKRLNLLLQDVERAMRVVAGDRPIQVLIAGKAHPRDEGGKRLVQELFSSKHAPGFAERVAYLNDYDLRMAAWLVRGCDVWINLPRPPLEASGTSGMKNVINGGLQLSVLDGWWAEGYDGDNGWALSRRRRPRPRRAGRAPRPRALPAARGGGRARVLPLVRRRHPARLGRPHPPLAAHARAGVRRRAHARGLREEGLQDRALGPDLGRGASPSERLGRGRRRWASAVGLAPSPSASASASGVGVGNGVGVGTAAPRRAAGGARVELLLDVLAEAVQARVEVLVDLVDAVVDPVLEDLPGDDEHHGHAEQDDRRRRPRASTGVTPRPLRKRAVQ